MNRSLKTWNPLFAGAYILFLALSGCDRDKSYRVEYVKIHIDSLDQITMLDDSLVRPIVYSGASGFDQLPVDKAKAKFIAMLLPSVLIAKHELEEEKNRLKRLCSKKHWSKADSLLYFDARNRFKATSLDNLIYRMGSLPNSVVLAQAAVESGWGKSRFFREANNVFGVWSYNEGEPRIRAGHLRKDAMIHLKVYDDLTESITDYFETLGSARAYRSLRKARAETEDPFALLPHLKYYSERRERYTKLLEKVILHNELIRYDHFSIDPKYLVEE